MATKFDFLSPGVLIREVDNSVLPAETIEAGPILIGRSPQGPAMQPIRIRSYEDFVDIFGAPSLGTAGGNQDVWRAGFVQAPNYAGIAAQAHLASDTTPVTFVRLLGDDSSISPVSVKKPGWTLTNSGPNIDPSSNSAAYGLFLVNSGAVDATNTTGSLAAVFYVDTGYMTLSGTAVEGALTSSAGTLIKSQGANKEFKAAFFDTSNVKIEEISFNFDRDDNSKYIRSQFNTNPVRTNSDLVTSENRKNYWLGETFDRFVADTVTNTAAGEVYGILLPLQSGSVDWFEHQESHKYAQTGFVIAQDQGAEADFDPASSNQKLFRFISLHGGNSIQKKFMIGISDITLPVDTSLDNYASFNVEITDLAGNIVEEFRGVNLNPDSDNYIVTRIGDTSFTWSDTEKKYTALGQQPNNSNYVRVEVSGLVEAGGASGLVPFGFLGPVRPKGFSLVHLSKGPNTFGDVINDAAAASATITTVAEASLVDTKDFILTDANGIATRYNISTGLATTDNTVAYTPGGEDGRGPAGTITIGMLGTTSRTDVRDQIIARINAGTNIGFVATATGNDVLVTQLAVGTVGNKTNTEPDGSTGLTVGNFTGGTDDTDDFAGAFVKGNENFPANGGDTNIFAHLPTDYTASFRFPKIALRGAGSEGNPVDEFDVYYGIRPKQLSSNSLTDDGYVDYVRRLPVGVNSFTPGSDFEHSFVFSMDDLVVNSTTRTVTYTSGSRVAGTSRTATSGAADLITTLGIKQFMMPLFGGIDGLDITEKEPFRNSSGGTLDGQTAATSTGIFTLIKAVDTIRDSEQVIANTLAIPGITNTTITDKVISMCEDRKDLLGVIDLENGYQPLTEGPTRVAGSLSSTISSARSRKLNSSFACAFYPWVQVAANNGEASGRVWNPPSVAAIGAFANSERQSELWFAPAGFSRGGLSPLGGVGGPRVVNVDGTLTARNRDDLYQININPIASFPGEGIVIFGQKTLQATPSALDRINVRRLLIYLKGELSRISRSLLFQPNVNATWLSFKTQAERVLSEVKANFGVTDYKVVLDETTTTADLIDRNILYAKVFIKPTRAIEYIVVDLIVTNTGAEFV